MFNNALKLLKDEVMQRFFLPFFLTGTMIMVFVMGKTGAPLKTTATPNGIFEPGICIQQSEGSGSGGCLDVFCYPFHR